MLHLFKGELMTTRSAGFPVEVFLLIHQLFRAVLVLMHAGVLPEQATPHCLPQLCQGDTLVIYTDWLEVNLLNVNFAPAKQNTAMQNYCEYWDI